jgi:hypothetical protein
MIEARASIVLESTTLSYLIVPISKLKLRALLSGTWEDLET